MEKRIITLLALMLTLTCQPVFAENLLLEEISVRGQKESANEESLSIREVRESPARDMGEALKQIEGLSYVRKGAIANDIVLRGLAEGQHQRVLVDGVRLHGAWPCTNGPAVISL